MRPNRSQLASIAWFVCTVLAVVLVSEKCAQPERSVPDNRPLPTPVPFLHYRDNPEACPPGNFVGSHDGGWSGREIYWFDGPKEHSRCLTANEDHR
jgi:hypothetical protein